MKKLILGLCFVFLSAQSAFAVLSPLDQSIRELSAIVQSKELRNSLQTGEAIIDIWKLGSRYIVSTENRQVVIEVTYSPRSTPGPQEFKLVFYPPRSFEPS